MDFYLQFSKGTSMQIDHDPNEKQPFFSSNAKPFFMQLAFVLIVVIIGVPFIKPLLKPYTDNAVEGVFNATCSIGLCTQEAAERLSAPTHQQ